VNIRILIGLWKANIPAMVWATSPLIAGSVILGLAGESPDWRHLGLFIATATLGLAIAESAGTYADREEDRLYFPHNPLVTGELDAGTAKKALIIQNIVAGALGLALAIATLDCALVFVMIACWLVALAYSLPPPKLKETPFGPLTYAVGTALLPLAGWLIVASPGKFVGAFAAFLFVYNLGYGVTIKFRKTYHAFNSGLLKLELDKGIYSLNTIGLGLKVGTAVALEAVTMLGAFILVPVFWHLDIFSATIAIGLLALPLPVTAIGVILRIKEPVRYSKECTLVLTLAWQLIMLVLLATALTGVFQWHWGFVILTCIAFMFVLLLLLRTIQPFRRETLISPWHEL